jgi:glycosyltransferase involved in cell wall biosynthesis
MDIMESECRTQDETGASNRETLALIIPTLNEAQNIRNVLNRVRSVLDPVGIDYEILVVDDDSSDGTGEIVSAIGLEDPRVRLIVRKGAKGVAGATLLGWENTDASIVGAMDADLQHPPELVPALVAEILAGHDVAIGSRYADGGSLGNWNLPRKLLSNAALWVAMPVLSWFAANASIRSNSSVRASSCYWMFWCAAASARSKRFPTPSRAATTAQARLPSRLLVNMPGC